MLSVLTQTTWRTRAHLATARVVLVLTATIGIATFAWAATPVPMATNPTYTENFSDIANWTSGFASGIGANRFGGIASSAGIVPTATVVTAATTTFTTGSTGGVQQGTGDILLLAPGAADNTTSAAIDFFMDFTGATAGNLSFDWAEVDDGTGDRAGALKVYSSTDGSTWTELSGAAVGVVNNVASSGMVTVALPAGFDGNSGARLRWYYFNGTGGTTGSRPKLSLDNLTVTAVTFAITASAGANGSIAPPGVTAVNSGGSQAYTITPNSGYLVQDVLVDAISVGAVTSYTFTNVLANHTLSASFTLDPNSLVSAGSSGTYVTTVNPSVPVPITLTRGVTTPMLGFSVSFTLSGLTTTAGTITEGGFLLAGDSTTSFQVIDNGGGSYTVDGVTLGTPCGSSATSGTLFNVGVSSTLLSGPGTLTINSVTLRDCSNATLPSSIGTAASVNIDRSTPAVAVTSPNGGESWLEGSVHAITWTATDPEGIAANSITLEYSANNGSSWLPVASGLANSGTFNWTVPANPSTTALVRATALDVQSNSTTDASDAASTIQGTTTTALTSAPNPSVTGESVTLTATVDPPTATGSVEFFDGAVSRGVAAVLNGNVVIGTTELSTGAHSLTAVYSGGALYSGSTSAAHSHTVNQGSTTTSLTSTPNPSVTGESVALTASVAVSPPGSGTATGSVEFFDGATSLGTVSLSGGSAVLNTASLAVGAHSLTAVYAGDASFTGSTSAAHSHTVNQGSTTTSLTSAPNPSVTGESVALTASVAVSPPGSGTATGSVEFFDGATSLGTVSLSGGSAVLNTASLAIGTHSVTAVYAGDLTHATSTSSAHSHTVNQALTTTSVTSTPNPSAFGQSVSISASVTIDPPGAGTTSGTVEFFDGATSLGTTPVVAGAASVNSSLLAVGSHNLTAVYSGDASFTGSTSAVHGHTVNPAATATSLTTTPNPSSFGQSVALSASVTVTAPGAGSPSGSVEFFDGATSLGTSPLVAGSASLNTSGLSVGPHSLTAVYSGDVSFSGSTSAVHTHTVNTAATTTSVVSSLNPSTFGQSVTFTATVTPAAATGSVEFFDSATSLGTSPLAAGTAALSTNALAAGSHSITAAYSGDTHYGSSTSIVLTQVVNAAGTTVSLVAAPSPGISLDPETLTATVAPAAATGAVEFFDGATSLGSSPVSSGTAVLVTSSLAVGVHSLTAHYSGDANHSGATSSAVLLEIQAKIVATAGPNGSITPSGTVLVSLGATPSFTFASNPGYHVASVTVDGGAAPLTSPYTFTPVSANHTIDVQFAVNPAVAAITTLASSQVRTGNGSSGRTSITLTWTPVPPGSTVEVWRRGYGNYPEYNGGPTPGSVPTTPASYPPAGWTLTAVTSPGGTDAPATRDFWYYVAYVRDIYGTQSPVSNQTSGALDYHLGDVSDGTTAGAGDNRVTTSDVSVLGMHYGLNGVAVAPYNYLDVGPTTDLSVTARPLTDDRINFEDLVLFAINFYPVASAPQAHARPAAAATDVITLSAPAHAAAGEDIVASLLFTGTGRMQAASVKLAWDPAVVEPVSYSAGDAVLDQSGVVFSAEPGTVDGASFAGAGVGLVGEGEFANVHFRVVTPGDPKFGFAKVDARDRNNLSLPVSSGVLAVAPKTFVTAFAPAMPNPFAHTTQFQFSLASPGRADLELFSVDGRRVRTLASGVREAGEYRLAWNGSDDSGRPLAAGVYYARLLTAHGKFTRVVTYLR